MLCFRPSAKLLLEQIYFSLASHNFFLCFQDEQGYSYTRREDKKGKKEERKNNMCGAPTMYQELSHVL